MTWTAPPRSADALAIYKAAESDRLTRPERYRLDVDTVVERASAGGKVSVDLFAEGWRSGLDQYLASAEADGRLNALGTRMVADTAVGRLLTGAHMTETLRAWPALEDVALTPPVVIVGGWRTGTTFLFRLLGIDSRLHAPLPSELSAPWRFPGMDASARAQFIDKAAHVHERLHVLNPVMAAVHPSGPRLAEECVLAMGTDFRNWGFTSTVRLDAYAGWLGSEDLGGSYRRYREVLRVLASDDPRRFVLKAPAHTAELPHLAATFPGAVVVHLHRDIVETVASGASLFAIFRSTYSDHVDPVDVGRYQTEQTERWLRRADAFRSSPAAAGVTTLDVEYGRLVSDPASVLRDIYAAASMPPPGDLPAFVTEYDRANPRHSHGAHTYDPADFGLDPADLRARFAFASTND